MSHMAVLSVSLLAPGSPLTGSHMQYKKCPVEHLSHVLFAEMIDADCAFFGMKVCTTVITPLE